MGNNINYALDVYQLCVFLFEIRADKDLGENQIIWPNFLKKTSIKLLNLNAFHSILFFATWVSIRVHVYNKISQLNFKKIFDDQKDVKNLIEFFFNKCNFFLCSKLLFNHTISLIGLLLFIYLKQDLYNISHSFMWFNCFGQFLYVR